MDFYVIYAKIEVKQTQNLKIIGENYDRRRNK